MTETFEVHPEIAKEMAEAAARAPKAQQFKMEQPVKPVAPVQQVAPVEEHEVQEAVQEIVQEQPVQQPTKEDHSNFKALRDAWRKAEKERDDAMRLLQYQQSLNQSQMQPTTPKQQYEEDAQLGADQLVVGKDLKTYSQQLKDLKDQLRVQQQQSYSENSKLRLKTKFPDFESIVNQETIEMLQVLQPEVAQTLNASSDIYAAGVTAYTLIKNLGLKPEENYQAEVQRIKINAAKPKPAASISPQQGESALSQANAFANGLTPDLKDQLYREMMAARKNY